MKKFILGLIVLMLLAVAGAYFYVTSIDWNQHKDKIAEQFYQVTGKTISFDGRLSFQIFPAPYLNAFNAKVYNPDNRDGKPLMEIKNLMAELALASLLKGEFEVKKMVLDGAVINFEWSNNGLNWQGKFSPDQRQIMEDMRMVLNSVSLKNAVVNLEAVESGKSLQLTNLNGEVSAQSVFGPFRIEGNYLKGQSPEGFALSIGKMSESFATTVNMVVTHPQSESYVRFDGNFHLINRVLNGNIIVESAKTSDFFNANFNDLNLPIEYNLPLVLGFDIALNSQNLSLTNAVIKYGDTQGAGTLQMPLEDTEITSSFNFTDLDLNILERPLQEFLDKYKEATYEPDYQIDFTAEVQAVRATYKGQGLKNLAMEFSLDTDTFTLDDLSVILPGDTTLKLKGSVFPYDETVNYQADVTVSASDLLRTLRWLNLEPKVNAASIYKKMLATAKLAGNFEKMQISPYKVTLDKSTFSGEAGIVWGARKDIMLVVNTDTVNFDNYISSLPEEEKAKSWAERMAYRFSKLGMLNDFDMVLDAKADLAIYESMPFEKIIFKGNVLQGVMDIENCQIGKVANTAVSLKGKLSGFGSAPQTEGLQYDISSNDIASLINKLELKVPNLDYKKISNLDMKGTINGSKDNFGINTLVTFGNLDAAYQGTVVKKADLFDFDGNLELKHSDFVALLNNLKVKYEPMAKNLGLLQFKAGIKGNRKELAINNMDANIGYTNLQGSLVYDHQAEQPSIMGDLKINKLEVDKFLQKTKDTTLIAGSSASEIPAFLAAPLWSREKFDYTPYTGVDVKGNFDIGELSYKSQLFKDAKFGFELVGGTANLSNFSAVYNNTPLTGGVALHMTDKPTLSANVKIDDANVNDFVFGGRIYNLKGGKFSTRFDFSSGAESEFDFVENLKGKAEIKVSATEVGGMNLKGIYDDLIQRELSSGLVEKVKAEIGGGKTLFEKVNGRMIVEGGKFSLADASMQTNNTEVKIYGEGDLKDWIMNVVFNVKYAEPNYLPEFSFSLKNSIATPTVDVNVSPLFNMYKAKEEQKEAAKEAEIEAEKNYWEGLVAEQRKAADDLVLSVRNKLEKDVDSKMELVKDTENINKLNLLKQEIAKVLTELVETMDNVNAESVDNAAIDELKAANLKALQETEVFAKKVEEVYLADLQKLGGTEYNKIVEQHNLLKQTIFSYNTNLDKYDEKLARILTDYRLENDTDFQIKKAQLESKISELEELNTKTINEQNLQKSDGTVAEYEEYNKKLQDTYTVLVAEREKLAEDIGALDAYILPKIAAAEKAYLDKIEQEENQRRLEENTGSISVKKTGVTKTVTRDLEEIKNVEQEISKEAVKVLDFSKEKISIKKPDTNDGGNIVKKGRHIRVN